MSRTLDPRFLRQIVDISIRFVHYETLSSLIPVVIISLAAAFVDQVFLIHLASPFRALWWLVVQSFLVARFTLGAVEGRFNADVFEHFSYIRIFPFMAKYLTISLLWAVPIFGLLFLLSPIEQIRISGLLEWLIAHVYLTGSEPFSPNFTFWLLLLAITSGAILPLLSAVLAATARSPLHAFFPSLWKHPFRTGTPILTLLVAFFGAILTAFLVYLPIFGAASVLAFQISPTLGALLGGLAIFLPMMSWPIIAGRLAGTWVYFHPLTSDTDLQIVDLNEVHMPPVIQTRNTASIPSLSESPLIAEPAVQVIEPPVPEPVVDPLLESLPPIRELMDSDITTAIRRLTEIKHSHPEDPRILGLEVQALIRMGQRPKALSLAIPAVQSLVQSSYANEIPVIFNLLGKERHTLPWDSTMLDLLVKVFLDAKDYKEAGWCAHTCELQMGNVVRAGKRLVQVADSASAAKDFASAVALLKYYVKHHPDGPFVDYAKKAVEFNQKQGE